MKFGNDAHQIVQWKLQERILEFSNIFFTNRFFMVIVLLVFLSHSLSLIFAPVVQERYTPLTRFIYRLDNFYSFTFSFNIIKILSFFLLRAMYKNKLYALRFFKIILELQWKIKRAEKG